MPSKRPGQNRATTPERRKVIPDQSLTGKAALLGLGFLFWTAPAHALVGPEVDGWQSMVRAATEACEAPGTSVFPEALSELGKLGSALAEAPLGDIMVELEERRGLDFLYFTPWHVKDRTELRAYLKASMAKEYPPKKVDETESMLKALGLARPDFQLIPFLEDLYTAQIAGAYDPDKDQFFLIDTEAGRTFRDRALGGARDALLAKSGLSMGDQASIVTIHELDHALGGQHFPLKEVFQDAPKWSTDQQMAALALIEGDATFVMIDHQRKTPPEKMGEATEILNADLLTSVMGALASFPVPIPGLGEFANAPLYFQKGLIFPYYSGAELVSSLRHSALDWSLVNAAYAALPISTEQIYHPDDYQYVSRKPQIADFSKLPEKLGAWTKVVDDTGGEFLLRVVLEQHGYADPSGAAYGWDGDRLRVYRDANTKKLGFFWALHWDNQADAEEFRQAAVASTPFQVQSGDKAVFLSSGLSVAESAALRAAIR